MKEKASSSLFYTVTHTTFHTTPSPFSAKKTVLLVSVLTTVSDTFFCQRAYPPLSLLETDRKVMDL